MLERTHCTVDPFQGQEQASNPRCSKQFKNLNKLNIWSEIINSCVLSRLEVPSKILPCPWPGYRFFPSNSIKQQKGLSFLHPHNIFRRSNIFSEIMRRQTNIRYTFSSIKFLIIIFINVCQKLKLAGGR